MTRTIKFDFHTHPIESLKEKMGIKGILEINRKVASATVQAVKSSGLNGIAITEHNNFNHSWVASLEIAEQFNRENLIILPGAEIDYGNQQYLSIYIPDRYRRSIPFFKGQEWFVILANPGYYNPLEVRNITDLNVDAVEGTSIHGDFLLASPISLSKNIPIIRSSDAHKLEDIGLHFSELEIR